MSVAANAGAVTISAPVVLGAVQTWSINGSGANGSSLIVSGAITGGAGATLAITSSGVTGVVSMNAATGLNTYSGTTTVSNGGILQGGATNSFSTNSDFIVDGTGILRLNGFSNTVRSLAGTGGTVQNNNASTAVTLTVGSSNASTVFSGAMVNGGTAALGLTKTGTGTLTLGGTNTYTGITTIQGGGLRITGSVINSPTGAGGTTLIGNTAGTFGLVDVPTGGSLTTTSLSVGGAAGGVGSLVIRGGSVSTTTTTTTAGISVGTGGYGSLLISGGSFATRRVSLYNSTTGTGVLQLSGGTLTSTEWIILSNLRTEFTVSGGNVIHNAASTNIGIGYNLSGTTVMNMAGGSVDNTGRSVSFGELGTGAPIGILNLGAGTLTTNTVTVGSTVNATLNFSGGTLRAGSIDSATFIPSSTRLTTYVNGAFGTFGGGAVIDTNGRSVTIAANLLSPAGSSGVSALSLGGVGSGYIGAPYVEIVRGAGDSTGTGATGYATIDTDPGSATYGQVTGVVLTNPGVNYTAAPTVNLIGGLGASGVAASVTASGLMANTSGGLTKVGAGTLTLTGANTYSGGTIVNAGTLTVGTGGMLGAAIGPLAVNNPNTGAGSAVVLNLATAVDTTVGSLSGTLATPSSGANTATINTQSSRNFTINQTAAGTYAGIIAGGGSLTLGALSTQTLTLTGTNTYTGSTTISAGSLQVGNAGMGTTGTGAVTLQSGSTLLGTGIVRGSSFMAESGSTIRAGDSAADSSFGTLSFTPASASGSTSSLQGGISLGISGATLTDATYGGNTLGSAGYNAWLDGVIGVGLHDRLVFNNPTAGTGYNLNFLTHTGSLQIIGSSFIPADGQVFNLLDWSNLVTPNFTGFTFSTGYLTGNGDEGADLDLPDISGTGLLWDFSRFSTSGNIAVILIPEPSRALLLVGGLLALVMRRRRSE
jgi:autotransporter-associated beta strand protein